MLNMGIFIFPKIIFYGMFSSQVSVFGLAYNGQGFVQVWH
jgi:hypothetical protein